MMTKIRGTMTAVRTPLRRKIGRAVHDPPLALEDGQDGPAAGRHAAGHLRLRQGSPAARDLADPDQAAIEEPVGGDHDAPKNSERNGREHEEARPARGRARPRPGPWSPRRWEGSPRRCGTRRLFGEVKKPAMASGPIPRPADLPTVNWSAIAATIRTTLPTTIMTSFFRLRLTSRIMPTTRMETIARGMTGRRA